MLNLQEHVVYKSEILQGKMMATKKNPWDFHPELVPSRLAVISEALLDVLHVTKGDLSSELDDNYTRGTATFGRQRQLLIQLARSKRYRWLGLAHAGMDVTVLIGGVPVRFFADDHENPKKKGFFRRNAVDSLFPISDTQPVLWRFIVEKALTDEDEDVVYFAGFNAFDDLVCEWRHFQPVKKLHVVASEPQAAVNIPSAPIGLRDDEELKPAHEQLNEQ